MNTEKIILKNYITVDIRKFFTKTKEGLHDNPGLFNELLLYESNYNRILEEHKKGLITDRYKDTEINRITLSSLELVDKVGKSIQLSINTNNIDTDKIISDYENEIYRLRKKIHILNEEQINENLYSLFKEVASSLLSDFKDYELLLLKGYSEDEKEGEEFLKLHLEFLELSIRQQKTWRRILENDKLKMLNSMNITAKQIIWLDILNKMKNPLEKILVLEKELSINNKYKVMMLRNDIFEYVVKLIRTESS